MLNTFMQQAKFNSPRPGGVHIRQYTRPSLFQITARRVFGAKPLSEPVLAYYSLIMRTYFSGIGNKIKHFYKRKWVWKFHLQNSGYCVSASMCEVVQLGRIMSCSNITRHWCAQRWAMTNKIEHRLDSSPPYAAYVHRWTGHHGLR